MEEKITSTLRLRMSAKDAHYGGELVDGAHMVHLFRRRCDRTSDQIGRRRRSFLRI